MIVIGVDPGYEETGFVVIDTTRIVPHRIIAHGHEPNERFIDRLRTFPMDTLSPATDDNDRGLRIKGAVLVIEQIESMGMAVGKTTFETVYWSGRFAEAWFPKRVERIVRRKIKIHICGHATAKDSNIRQAIVDRFGPSEKQAFGTKKEQGPIYGITGHKMAALAVALTWADQHANAPDGEIVRPGVVAEW